ncbi:MAG: divalent metal cation transporter [Patescibacteria group bacterium]|nr:divalent metal cation transporter [Patescibacteria group bacterium]
MSDNRSSIIGREKRAFSRFLRILGPGLVTGAADDDPSGIATYSQTGAQFGYGQLWTALFTLPLMTAVQEACARIGKVTGKGIVAVIKEHYSRKLVYTVVALVLIANTVNIGADIGAMAAAARLVVPVDFVLLTLGFTAFILVLQIFVSYRTYAKVLKWLALSMLSYVATVFMVHEPWDVILRATFMPHIELSFPFLFIIVAVIGTTISPYMFFWEADEEVEEEKLHHVAKAGGRPKVTVAGMRKLRWDNFLGMLSSNVVSWCIIVTSATVLFAHGVTDIGSAADAAQALEPLVSTFPNAGFLAKLLFATGVVGLGLLAVPVLSSSASYAVAEALEWKGGLSYKLKRAHGFYGVITIATVIGLCINFIGINPMKALVATAVLSGIVSVPLIFMIARIAASKHIMGEWRSGWLSKIFVWLTFVCMAGAAVAMLFTLF